MPSTYSSRLRLELPADGELTGLWGQATNRNLGTLLETSIAGYRTIALLDSNYTLTTSNGLDDDARYAMLNFTGTLTATRDVIVPAVSKLYLVKNQTNRTLNVKTATGAARAVPAGKTAYLFLDGVDAFDSFNDLTSLSVSGTANLSNTNTANLVYTGTLTGGTGEINIGSGQFYKSAAGAFGFGGTSTLGFRGVFAESAGNSLALLKSTATLTTESIRLRYYSANTNDGGTYDLGGIDYVREDGGFGVRSSMVVHVKRLGGAGNVVEAARFTPAGYFKASSTATYPAGVATAYHELVNDANAAVLVASSTSTGSAVSNYNSQLPLGANGYHAQFSTNNVVVHQVLANGNVQNATGTYGTISDAKLKENVVDAPSYLSKLMRVRFVNYNLKAETGLPTHKQFGVIAQEFEQVFPNLVYDTPDTEINEAGQSVETGTVTKGINSSVLTMIYGKVIQEQQAIIEQQESVLAGLLQRVVALEGRVNE